jgi:F-type H+-transporting ATPase subunit a
MFFVGSEDPLNHVVDQILFRIGPIPVSMHTVTLILVTIVFVLAMMQAAKAIATGPEAQGNNRYITKGRFAQMIEAMVVYLRDEMLKPVLGPEATRKYLPFLMTVFFFVLFNNIFGMLPIAPLFELASLKLPNVKQLFGGTATANLMVTAALALISFFVIEFHGFKELGFKGWLLHNCGGLVPGPKALYPIVPLVFTVELAGHFIKPTALAIRLFANMVAGHTLMAVLLAFGAGAIKGGMSPLGWGSITLVSGLAAVAVTFLELFVAFLQAFIFMFLTAVFISLLSHHADHEEHDAAHEMEQDMHRAHDRAKHAHVVGA